MPATAGHDDKRTVRIASFNIQTGIRTRRYEDYLFKSWQHVLPYGRRFANLEKIAAFLRDFDIVGLQEVDGGGSRSHYVIQTEYLARMAGFPYWYNQVNRRIGRVALHSNGLLSRLSPARVSGFALPGLPGRGAVLVRFGAGEAALVLVILHLALGPQARKRQLDFIAERIRGFSHVIVMGDLNCSPKAREMQHFLSVTGLRDPEPRLRTFPSWRPRRKLDHILVSPDIDVRHIEVYDFVCSDHLPIGAKVVLPAATLSMAA